MAAMSKKTYWILFSSLIVLSGILLLFRLGSEPFIDYDEASYASIIDSTLGSDDISVPLMLEEPSFEKPPLYYWLAMGSGSVFGNKEFAYRLPAALFGILSVALVMLIVLELSGSFSASLFAGVVLLTSGLYFEAARQVRLDVPVTACLLVSVFCFIKGWKDPRWYLGMGIGLGLGIMFKGVIGLLAIPIVIIWALSVRNWGWLKSRYTWIGAVAAILIAAPWHWREASLFGSAFWDRYIGFNILNRLGSNLMNNRGSTYGYAKELGWTLLPWSVAFVVAVAATIRRVLVSLEKIRENPLVAPVLVSLFIIALFLSSQTKLLYYFIPAAPFIAICVALLVWQIMLSPKASAKAVVSVCALFLVAGLAMMVYIGYDKYPNLSTWVQVAREERDVGRLVAAEPVDSFYVFQYPFSETLRYYSGNKSIIQLSEGDAINPPMLIVVPAMFYASKPFSSALQSRMIVKHEGESSVLLRID